MELKTKVLLDNLMFPEGPRWNVKENRFYFSDAVAKKVIAIDLEGNVETIVEMENYTSGLGFLPDESLLIVSMQNRRLYQLSKKNLTLYADLSELTPFFCNDMVVDGQGRAYVGNWGLTSPDQPPKPTNLILVDVDREIKTVSEGLFFPNGTLITPDEKNLIISEQHASRLTAFDIEYDGSLSNRRVWAEFTNFYPDGICYDVEGAIWAANPPNAEVIRILEGGKITNRIKVSTNAYACVLGGLDRRTLYICTTDIYKGKISSGRIEIIKVDVPGAGFP